MTDINRSAIRNLDPSEIYADIISRPPLMRAQAAKAYIGKDVDWVLSYANGNELSLGEAWVAFRSGPREIRMIAGTVPLSKYPELKSLPADTAVRVRGKIREVETLIIELDIAELSFGPTFIAAG